LSFEEYEEHQWRNGNYLCGRSGLSPDSLSASVLPLKLTWQKTTL